MDGHVSDLERCPPALKADWALNWNRFSPVPGVFKGDALHYLLAVEPNSHTVSSHPDSGSVPIFWR